MRVSADNKFFAARRKNIALEILLATLLIGNLKFKSGSIKTPKNLIAGTSESVVTRVRLDIRLGFGDKISLLLMCTPFFLATGAVAG